MTFKTNLETARCPALSGFGVLWIEGRDSAVFLQSQVMNDVSVLASGRWQWNGLLTPKGRVLVLFALAKVSDNRFVLISPDMAASALAAHLRRFVFRSQVTLDEDAGWVAAAGPAASTGDSGALAGDEDRGFALDFSAEGGVRWLWLLPRAHVALVPPEADVDAAWRAMDISHGFPRLGGDAPEAFTPHMLSLERLGAFSLKKGCYPGQEIVARTHYLGQSKRGLAQLRGVGLAPGQPVESAGQPVGTLVCTDASGSTALAVLAVDAGDELLSGGQPCTRESLLPGLARAL